MYFLLAIGNTDHKFFATAEDLMYEWLYGLTDFFSWFIDYSFNFGGQTYHLYEFMFGTGVIVFVTYSLAKWLIDIV